MPPAAQDIHIRLVGEHAERKVARVTYLSPKEYAIPQDGRVTINVPPLRHGCNVYLFGVIRVEKTPDESAKKMVEFAGAKPRELSFKELFKLPQDSQGYHLLKLPD